MVAAERDRRQSCVNIQDVDVQGFEQYFEGIHKPGLGNHILMLFFVSLYMCILCPGPT